eukprot:2852483-Rhodomonas_salina.1
MLGAVETPSLKRVGRISQISHQLIAVFNLKLDLPDLLLLSLSNFGLVCIHVHRSDLAWQTDVAL